MPVLPFDPSTLNTVAAFLLTSSVREATERMGVAAKAGLQGTPAKSAPTAPADDARKDRRFGFVNFTFWRMKNSVRLMVFLL